MYLGKFSRLCEDDLWTPRSVLTTQSKLTV